MIGIAAEELSWVVYNGISCLLALTQTLMNCGFHDPVQRCLSTAIDIAEKVVSCEISLS